MTTRAADGVHRTDPVFTPVEDADPPAAPATENTWESWVESRVDAVLDAVGEELGRTTAEFKKRTRELELQLAEMRGAVDVLRHKGTDNADETTEKMRADFQGKIKEIELKLATAIGMIDVLKGKGLPGCLRIRGTYDAKTTYQALDIVAKDSSSFVAVRDSPGPLPGDGWQMIAAGGRRGVAGEKGERGPPGPVATPLKWTAAGLNFRDGVTLETKLSDGSPGTPVQLFRSISVNDQDFTLRFVGCDGSVLRISLLPLFKAYHHQTTG